MIIGGSSGVVTDRLATMQTADSKESFPEASGLLSLQSASGFCSCQKPGCFSFNTTYEPHVVILCDCKDWSVASICPWYLHAVLLLPWSILLSYLFFSCRAAGLPADRLLWFFSWRERAKRQFKDSTVEGKAERLPLSHVASPQADPVADYRKPILVSVCALSCIRGSLPMPDLVVNPGMSSLSRAASAESGVSGRGQVAEPEEETDSLFLRVSYCEACKSAVLFSYGKTNKEVFVGVAQGCYPRGTQLHECNVLVDYWSDGKPLSQSCVNYFSRMKHAEVSGEMLQALQKAGVLTQDGEMINEESVELVQRKPSTDLDTYLQNGPSKPAVKRVHPWPVSGAPRLPTSSARVKGMGSCTTVLSAAAYGVGEHYKTGHASQYIPHPAHITVESPALDMHGNPVLPKPTCSALDQLQSSAKSKALQSIPPDLPSVFLQGPMFRMNPYGAVLSRRPLVSQLSARRISASAPASGPPRPRIIVDNAGSIANRKADATDVTRTESSPATGRGAVDRSLSVMSQRSQHLARVGSGVVELMTSTTPRHSTHILKAESVERVASSSYGVVFDDGTAPGPAVDIILENTVQELKLSLQPKAGNQLLPVGSFFRQGARKNLLPTGTIAEGESTDHTSEPGAAKSTTFSECMLKAKELLEASAKTAGKYVGANGQIVDADEWNQAHTAKPFRFLQMEAQFAEQTAQTATDMHSASVAGSVDRTSSSSRFSASTTPSRPSALGSFVLGKLAARFRQKVFKKVEAVIVSGSEESSYLTGLFMCVCACLNLIDHVIVVCLCTILQPHNDDGMTCRCGMILCWQSPKASNCCARRRKLWKRSIKRKKSKKGTIRLRVSIQKNMKTRCGGFPYLRYASPVWLLRLYLNDAAPHSLTVYVSCSCLITLKSHDQTSLFLNLSPLMSSTLHQLYTAVLQTALQLL